MTGGKTKRYPVALIIWSIALCIGLYLHDSQFIIAFSAMGVGYNLGKTTHPRQ